MKSVSEIRATIASILYHEGDVEYNGGKTYGAVTFLNPVSVEVENYKGMNKHTETANGMYIDPNTGDIVVDVSKMRATERLTADSWNNLYTALVND